MGRVDWRNSSWPFPPPPFFTAQCQSHMRSSPVVSQRSRTQQYVWKIALPLIIKVGVCIAGNLPQFKQCLRYNVNASLLHMHKPGEDPGVFLNTCWGDLELLGFILMFWVLFFFSKPLIVFRVTFCSKFPRGNSNKSNGSLFGRQ